MRQKVELHIEELVLEGFEPGDEQRIGEAVERELTRLLEVKGVPGSFRSNREMESINGGSFEAAAGARAERVGTQVAGAVYGGLKR